MAEEWGYGDKTTGEGSDRWFKSSGILELLYKHRHCLNELYSEIAGFNLEVLGIGIEPIEWLIERESHEIILESDYGNEVLLSRTDQAAANKNIKNQVIDAVLADQHERPFSVIRRYVDDDDWFWVFDASWKEYSAEALAEKLLTFYRSVEYIEWIDDKIVYRVIRVKDFNQYKFREN